MNSSIISNPLKNPRTISFVVPYRNNVGALREFGEWGAPLRIPPFHKGNPGCRLDNLEKKKTIPAISETEKSCKHILKLSYSRVVGVGGGGLKLLVFGEGYGNDLEPLTDRIWRIILE